VSNEKNCHRRWHRAGKSAVGKRLRDLGFPVVDADDVPTTSPSPQRDTLGVVTRSAVPSGTPRLSLDRVFVADVVFHDASALRRPERDHARADRCGDRPTTRRGRRRGSLRAIPLYAPSTRPCSPGRRCGPCRYRRRRPCDDSSTDADSVKPTRGPVWPRR